MIVFKFKTSPNDTLTFVQISFQEQFDRAVLNMGKRENLVTIIFSFFHKIFKSIFSQSHENCGLIYTLKIYCSGKHCEKRRNCLYKQFLLFPQCFLLYQRQKLSFFFTFNLQSTNAFNLVGSKILSCRNRLRTEAFFMLCINKLEFINLIVSSNAHP